MTETAHTPLPELLPCPFCGADAHYEQGGEWQYYDTWAVECVGCGAQINGSTDMRVSGATAKCEALTAWNTRADSHHRLVEALAGLLAALHKRWPHEDFATSAIFAEPVTNARAALKEAGR